ncbi:NUDIX hydrolase domain-like protein [Aspergillus spectabilis]
MATSIFPTTQYTSEQFVESCGAVLFDLSQKPKRVCLILYRHRENDEWLLPKGRRNRGESRRQAALREVEEETGYKCRIYPVTVTTRAPQADDPENVPDIPRLSPDLSEPFMFTVRELTPGSDVKLIWWYIAAVDEGSKDGAVASNGDFRAEFFHYDDALRELTFQKERDILKGLLLWLKTANMLPTVLCINITWPPSSFLDDIPSNDQIGLPSQSPSVGS